jgi:hypothetical protein
MEKEQGRKVRRHTVNNGQERRNGLMNEYQKKINYTTQTHTQR